MRKINHFLTNRLHEERDGFSGVNHVMIAIMLFVGLFFLPIPPFCDIAQRMNSNPMTLIYSFLIVCGGALLTDMDNLKSDGGSQASWDLGVLGSIISALMVTISSIMTTVFRGKRDVKPMTQHRFFWHTLIVPAIIIALSLLLIPNTDTKVIDLFSNISLTNFPTHVIVAVFAIVVTIYVGAMTLLKKIKKFLPFAWNAGLIAMFIAVIAGISCVVLSTEADLRFYCFCIGLGYLCHLIGDLFADGGIPALFPIPIRGQFFHRIKLLPVTVKTGSVLESILKVVFLAIDLVLIYLLFTLVILK